MDENLIHIEDKFIQEVIENGGTLDLDFSNDLHYNYYYMQLEKLGANSQKTPHLMKLLESQRSFKEEGTTKLLNNEDMLIGPNDIVFIDIPEIKHNKSINALKEDNRSSIIHVNSVAKYCKRKKKVVIQSTMRDNIRKRSVTETRAFETCKVARACLEMNEENLFDGKPRNYTIISNFTSVEQAQGDEKPRLKASCSVKETVAIETDIIEEFTLIDPKPKKTKGKEVKVSYNRDTVLKDFDYSINNSPMTEPKTGSQYIKIKLDVFFRIRLRPGYRINGLMNRVSPILTIDHPHEGVIKCYYYSKTDTPLVKIIDERTIEVAIPKKEGEHEGAEWDSIIPFDDLENKASVGLNIYGQFTLSITDLKDGITLPLPVSFRSEKGDIEFTKQNIETESIFMQWGCIGKDTLITLTNRETRKSKISESAIDDFVTSDDEERRTVKISEINIGDFIIDSNGHKREVVDIITGNESTIVSITTDTKRNILLTKAHSIKADGQWRTVGELKVGMKVQCEKGIETVETLTEQLYGDIVYNLKFKEETEIIGNGFIIGDYHMQQRIKPYKEEEEDIIWSEETELISRELESLNINKGV